MYQCDTCSRIFTTLRASEQHMDALDHWGSMYKCDTCPNTFQTQHACDEHMTAFGHWRNYCAQCNRQFQNENNLRMHLNSRIHRGNDIACPFCKRGFVTASGVSHHLETGSCPNAPGVNRDSIYRVIRERDPYGFITHKQLEWHGETPTQTWVPEGAWNGWYYECYLCHREFTTPQALNQHINSPAHQEKVYHCPSHKCARPFVTLAAMFNHLESESCGYVRFETVQQNVNGLLTGRQRLIGFG